MKWIEVSIKTTGAVEAVANILYNVSVSGCNRRST